MSFWDENPDLVPRTSGGDAPKWWDSVPGAHVVKSRADFFSAPGSGPLILARPRSGRWHAASWSDESERFNRRMGGWHLGVVAHCHWSGSAPSSRVVVKRGSVEDVECRSCSDFLQYVSRPYRTEIA